MNETTRMLALLNDSFPDLTALSPLAARAAADARIRPVVDGDDIASTENRLIALHDRTLAVRIYRPHTARSEAPVAIYAHGGGFLHGSIEGHDGFCRRWAHGTGMTVVSVAYRLAPDAAPPAARDDIVAAVDWSQQHGFASHGVVLAGDSSGANLAAGAALILRNRGNSPAIAQVLLYPFLDPSMKSRSYRTRETGYFVTKALLDYYWCALLGENRERYDTDVTPLAADDLTELPPAIVVTAGLDPLCDEGTLYAQRLRDAAVTVIHRHYSDQFHGFMTIAGYGPASSASDVLWSDVRSLSHPEVKDS